MTKYCVYVNRITTETTEVEVDASHPEVAAAMAVEKVERDAGNHKWGERDIEFFAKFSVVMKETLRAADDVVPQPQLPQDELNHYDRAIARLTDQLEDCENDLYVRQKMLIKELIEARERFISNGPTNTGRVQ